MTTQNQEATCKGCYSLGTACGECARCAEELAVLYVEGKITQCTHNGGMEWFRKNAHATALRGGTLEGAQFFRPDNYAGEVKPSGPPRMFHKVGSARTIRTAVACAQWLQDHLCQPRGPVARDAITYKFTGQPTQHNGWWSADIYVEGALSLDEGTRFVEQCRAFVAGAGEVW